MARGAGRGQKAAKERWADCEDEADIDEMDCEDIFGIFGNDQDWTNPGSKKESKGGSSWIEVVVRNKTNEANQKQ